MGFQRYLPSGDARVLTLTRQGEHLWIGGRFSRVIDWAQPYWGSIRP